MARASGSEEATRGVEFALDSFELADGRLVVAGRWYGVTGRRFVRPVLQAPGQRRLVALLDHKPWSAEEGAPWLAAFPDGGYAGPSRLQVAPDIAVELPAAGPGAGDGAPRPARLTRPPIERGMGEAEPAPPEPAEQPAPQPRKRKVERDPAAGRDRGAPRASTTRRARSPTACAPSSTRPARSPSACRASSPTRRRTRTSSAPS